MQKIILIGNQTFIDYYVAKAKKGTSKDEDIVSRVSKDMRIRDKLLTWLT